MRSGARIERHPSGSAARAARAGRSRDPVRRRPHFETFLLELSAAFVRLRPNITDEVLQFWLGKVARFMRVDQIALWELLPDGRTVHRAHSHVRRESAGELVAISTEHAPWITRQCRAGKVVAWSRIPADVPKPAIADGRELLRRGIHSFLGIPSASGAVLRLVTFAARHYRRWSRRLVRCLRIVCEIFACAVERGQVKASLHASEARNRALLRALPDTMYVLSPEGVYLDYHVNDPTCLPAPPEQLIGLNIHQLLPPHAAAVFQAGMTRAVRSGEVVEVEYQLLIRGELRDREARLARRDDGAIVSIVRDTTERNRAVRRLRESEERFRGAFEYSACGMALVSPEGRWLEVNAALCAILGYSAAELLAVSFQSLTHPDDLERNLSHLRRALAGEIDHYEIEKRYIHKDGRIIPVLLTVSAVRDAQRRPLYFVSQIQNLSERKQAEVEIEHLRLELTHSGRVALTGQLAASLAHEFMHPLSAVRSNAEAGRRLLAAGKGQSGAMQAILDDIVASCARAADVINSVRSLLRKERQPHRLLDLNRLVREVIGVTRQELMLRHVRLLVQLHESLPRINGNAIELQQVILNLLLNGAEALSRRDAAHRTLRIATVRRDLSVQVSVSDCGAGVDPADLERIFEPFVTTKPEGMGMGLAICAEIVRAHAGRLWAENNSAGGLTVHCALPCAQ